MQSLLFLMKFYYFPQTVDCISSDEILQLLRSIEFPLRFIQLYGHKLDIFGIFCKVFRTAVLMNTLKK